MKKLVRAFRRFILKQRIDMLRGDIAATRERLAYSELSVESANNWLDAAHVKMRRLRSELALLERPEILLKDVQRG